MVDNILQSDEIIARSSLLVRQDNIFVSNGELGEPALVENIAQTAAAGMGLNSKAENKPVSVGYIGAISNLIIFALPKVGDVLETEIVTVNQVFNVSMISGKIWCNQVLFAQCEMKIFITQ